MTVSFVSKVIRLSAITAERFWKEEGILKNSWKCFIPLPRKDCMVTVTQLVSHPLVPAGKTSYYKLLPVTLYFLYWDWRAKKRHMGLCSLSPTFSSLYIYWFNVLGIYEILSIETTSVTRFSQQASRNNHWMNHCSHYKLDGAIL